MALLVDTVLLLVTLCFRKLNTQSVPRSYNVQLCAPADQKGRKWRRPQRAGLMGAVEKALTWRTTRVLLAGSELGVGLSCCFDSVTQ